MIHKSCAISHILILDGTSGTA